MGVPGGDLVPLGGERGEPGELLRGQGRERPVAVRRPLQLGVVPLPVHPDGQLARGVVPDDAVGVDGLLGAQPAADRRVDHVLHDPQGGDRHQVVGGEHLHDPRALGEDVVQCLARRDQPLTRVGRQLGAREPLGVPLQQQEQQLVLVAHVVVERHRGARQLRRQPPHRQVLGPLRVQDVLGGREDGLLGQAGWASGPAGASGLRCHPRVFLLLVPGAERGVGRGAVAARPGSAAARPRHRPSRSSGAPGGG